MTYVQQPDVEAELLRPLTAAEATYLPGLISQLESKMPQAIITRIVSWDEVPRPATAINPVRAAAVLAGILKRYLTNPKGAASTSDTAGPQSHTESFTSYGKTVGDGTPGELRFTDQDIADFNERSTSMRFGSIRLRPALAPHPGHRW